MAFQDHRIDHSAISPRRKHQRFCTVRSALFVRTRELTVVDPSGNLLRIGHDLYDAYVAQ